MALGLSRPLHNSSDWPQREEPSTERERALKLDVEVEAFGVEKGNFGLVTHFEAEAEAELELERGTSVCSRTSSREPLARALRLPRLPRCFPRSPRCLPRSPRWSSSSFSRSTFSRSTFSVIVDALEAGHRSTWFVSSRTI